MCGENVSAGVEACLIEAHYMMKSVTGKYREAQ